MPQVFRFLAVVENFRLSFVAWTIGIRPREDGLWVSEGKAHSAVRTRETGRQHTNAAIDSTSYKECANTVTPTTLHYAIKPLYWHPRASPSNG